MPLPVHKKKKNCLHANVQWVYIMKAGYEIVPSKTVVGVDRPVNALTCKQKEEKLSKFS